MEELQDILLQADLGMTTAEDIVEEVKSLREDSLEPISRNDLKSIMRGKIIEALETGKPRAIRFSDDSSLPTVLFVMVRISPFFEESRWPHVILTDSFPSLINQGANGMVRVDLVLRVGSKPSCDSNLHVSFILCRAKLQLLENLLIGYALKGIRLFSWLPVIHLEQGLSNN